MSSYESDEDTDDSVGTYDAGDTEETSDKNELYDNIDYILIFPSWKYPGFSWPQNYEQTKHDMTIGSGVDFNDIEQLKQTKKFLEQFIANATRVINDDDDYKFVHVAESSLKYVNKVLQPNNTRGGKKRKTKKCKSKKCKCKSKSKSRKCKSKSRKCKSKK